MTRCHAEALLALIGQESVPPDGGPVPDVVVAAYVLVDVGIPGRKKGVAAGHRAGSAKPEAAVPDVCWRK